MISAGSAPSTATAILIPVEGSGPICWFPAAAVLALLDVYKRQVISHDRYFLDKITSRTFEMEGKGLAAYKGNYSNYLKLKAEQRLAMERVYESTRREISRIEGIIEQQKRWNQERNYVTIASKQKAIEMCIRDSFSTGR